MRSAVPGIEDKSMRTKAALVAIVVVGVAAYLGLRPAPSSGKPGVKASAAAEEAPAPAPLGQRTGAQDDEANEPLKPKQGQGSALFTASWGGKDDQLGRERPSEGNPMGPMSFDVDGKGRVHVLDGVNGRLVTRGADGKTESTTVLDAPYPEDVAVADDGSSAVLDRHRDKSVSLYDENGKRIGKLPLEGENVPDVGSVTGVFVDGKDVYVEKEHGPLVKLGTMGGIAASPRTEIPGRPTRDGLSFINAGIIEAPAVASTFRPSTAPRTSIVSRGAARRSFFRSCSGYRQGRYDLLRRRGRGRFHAAGAPVLPGRRERRPGARPPTRCRKSFRDYGAR
jgi:hypothetical protein